MKSLQPPRRDGRAQSGVRADVRLRDAGMTVERHEALGTTSLDALARLS